MGKKLAKKLGRPPLMGQSTMRAFRVPDEDYAKWELTARARGLSVSEWLRELCNAAVRRDEKRDK